MGNVYKVDVAALCRARGWHMESDGGAADGWTARVGVPKRPAWGVRACARPLMRPKR